MNRRGSGIIEMIRNDLIVKGFYGARDGDTAAMAALLDAGWGIDEAVENDIYMSEKFFGDFTKMPLLAYAAPPR